MGSTPQLLRQETCSTASRVSRSAGIGGGAPAYTPSHSQLKSLKCIHIIPNAARNTLPTKWPYLWARAQRPFTHRPVLQPDESRSVCMPCLEQEVQRTNVINPRRFGRHARRPPRHPINNRSVCIPMSWGAVIRFAWSSICSCSPRYIQPASFGEFTASAFSPLISHKPNCFTFKSRQDCEQVHESRIIATAVIIEVLRNTLYTRATSQPYGGKSAPTCAIFRYHKIHISSSKHLTIA